MSDQGDTQCAETTTGPTTSTAATTDHPVIQATADASLYRTRMAALKLASADATDEDFLTARNTLDGLKAMTRGYAELVETACLEYLQRRGTIETETDRYYLGKKRTTKCRNTRATVEAILNTTGGDLDKLVEMMASQPLKHGVCKGVLGDEWDKHFETTETETVEVKAVDKRFIR